MKFLEKLKQLHINLPFIDALAQMPKYAKFLKDQSIKKPPADDDECYGIDDLDDTINTEAQELQANDRIPIRYINFINMPYSVEQRTARPDGIKSEHLYSASANEIDEKRPELKNLPNHLEYTYLQDDKSFPIIISSKLSEKETKLLLQVLEKRKGAIAWKMSDIKKSVRRFARTRF
ncbi:hypothetical protein Tco_1324497 [Tanacetum coccineum]